MVAYLRPALDSDDTTTRELAYQLLGHAGTEKDFQPALQVLADVLRGQDDARRVAAADALGRIAPRGGVPQLVRTQGYIAHWRVLGTFLNDLKNTGFDKSFPPEKKIDFAAKYKAKYVWQLAGEGPHGKGEIEREIEWAKASVDRTDGKLNVPTVVPPPGSLWVAYAVADFRSTKARGLLLHVDGDDSFRIWLNGEKIAEMAAPYKHRQPCVVKQEGIQIRVKAGANRLVVKTTNIEYQWWIRLRLTDEAGEPVEVSP